LGYEKTPRTKLQHPEKLETSTFKSSHAARIFGAWTLEVSLELGAWCLELFELDLKNA
jgi:hypothetical protein